MMSSTTFDPTLLDSPFVSLDQLITSLTYSAHTVNPGQNFSLFLVPASLRLYPMSLLGYLYSELLQYPQIKRIVYLREGDADTILSAGDSAIDCVLGGSIPYDTNYYSNYPALVSTSQKNFFTNNSMWSHHMFYVRYLTNVSVVPFVLPKNNGSDSVVRPDLIELLSDIVQDDSTVCVLLSDYSFHLHEDVVDKTNNSCDLPHDILEAYCLSHSREPSLLECEIIDGEEGAGRYQGIFVV